MHGGGGVLRLGRHSGQENGLLDPFNGCIVGEVARSQLEVFTLQSGLLKFQFAHDGEEFQFLGFQG